MRSDHRGFTLTEVMMALAVIGILAAVAIPSFRSYITRARVDEAATLVTPISLALGLACRSNDLATADHAKLGLPASTAYETPKVVQSISAQGVSATEARITVVLKAFSGVSAGATLIYKGACAEAVGISWQIDAASTLPAKFWPKI